MSGSLLVIDRRHRDGETESKQTGRTYDQLRVADVRHHLDAKWSSRTVRTPVLVGPCKTAVQRPAQPSTPTTVQRWKRLLPNLPTSELCLGRRKGKVGRSSPLPTQLPSDGPRVESPPSVGARPLQSRPTVPLAHGMGSCDWSGLGCGVSGIRPGVRLLCHVERRIYRSAVDHLIRLLSCSL